MGVIKFLNKKRIIVISIILFFVLISIFIYYLSPSKIVNIIGIQNSYIIIVILGFLGGVSILFPFPYYLFVLTFAAGGSNPVLLGICAGLGVMIGESTSYLIGYHGRVVLPQKYNKIFNKLCRDCNRAKNTILLTIVLFLYGAFVPFPNDLLILPLGAARYNYWKLIIPLGLGNILFNVILAFGGIYGWNLFFV